MKKTIKKVKKAKAKKVVKKAVKKAVKVKKVKKAKKLGEVTHWYDNINVAVVKLHGVMKTGDKVKIKRGDSEFEEIIESMQFDHEPIKAGKKGQEIAIKLIGKTKDGAEVFLCE
jgi:translation initiation factor IF-2